MRALILTMLCLIGHQSFALHVDVVTRDHLKFQASSIEASSRFKESFDVGQTDPEYQKLIVKSVQDVAAFLPSKYQQAAITINLESNAEFTDSKSTTEQIPMSVLLSTQLFGKNQIRICDHEIRNNPDAVKTLISHEMGHIIIEWAWRASGVVPADKLSNWLWTKSIYEGVADYLSATANDTTKIGGGSKNWYGRDILKYPTRDEAQRQTLLSTAAQIKFGLKIEGLLKYKTYSSLINDIETELKEKPLMPDSNAEGSWLAGRLWLLNSKYGKQRVIDAVLKIALEGQKHEDIQVFLKEVKSTL